jgi:hypothetical protein
MTEKKVFYIYRNVYDYSKVEEKEKQIIFVVNISYRDKLLTHLSKDIKKKFILLFQDMKHRCWLSKIQELKDNKLKIIFEKENL